MTWMKRYNPTKFNHENNSVAIRRKNNKIVLQGISKKGNLSMISESSMGKVLRKGQAIISHLFMVQARVYNDQTEVNEQIQKVFLQYKDVFEEPKSLPPAMSLNHTIPLKTGAEPVSLRPSRYIYYQNSKLEK